MILIYQTLSAQLLSTALFLCGLALIILSVLSKRITKPIVSLAKVTDEVVKGRYGEIVLPQVEPSDSEISVLTNSFAKMIQGLQDKDKIRNLLNKVVSKEIADEILKGKVQLGGESKVVTMLFADIRGFTTLTERVDPQRVILGLNAYMTMMSRIIEQHGGVIDKYVGDEIIALYGAPVEIEGGARKAILTALEMLKALKAWNEERNNVPLVEVGIGIHTGDVVAGNMGADTRLNYTVLGANVNLTARLCAAARPMQILVTQETLEASGLKDELHVTAMAPTLFKGFSEPITTYSVSRPL